MMDNKKGVTLTSLTIYVIVLVIILAALTFVSANYTSQIADVTARGRISNEYTKFYSFLINDIKSADKVIEFSDEYIRLNNDIKYEIRYKYISEKENQRRQYEIYRNDIKISENILDANFDYDEKSNVLAVNLRYLYGSIMMEKNQNFKVGRGY